MFPLIDEVIVGAVEELQRQEQGAARLPALAGGLCAPGGLRGKGMPRAGGYRVPRRQINIITVLPTPLLPSPTLPLMVIIIFIRDSAANGDWLSLL